MTIHIQERKLQIDAIDQVFSLTLRRINIDYVEIVGVFEHVQQTAVLSLKQLRRLQSMYVGQLHGFSHQDLRSAITTIGETGRLPELAFSFTCDIIKISKRDFYQALVELQHMKSYSLLGIDPQRKTGIRLHVSSPDGHLSTVLPWDCAWKLLSVHTGDHCHLNNPLWQVAVTDGDERTLIFSFISNKKTIFSYTIAVEDLEKILLVISSEIYS